MKKILTSILLMAMSLLMLTGCDESIFDFGNEEVVREYSKEDLQTEVFYIKNGTKFYTLPVGTTTFSGASQKISPSRHVIFTDEEMENLPVLYSNETFAIISQSNIIEPRYLERFYDCGYSFGITGATYDIEGYIYFEISKNVHKGSDAQKYFKNSYADQIRIETINGQKVSADMLTEGGVIKGLQKDTSYTITFYAGTVYQTATIKADTRIMESFEMYQTEASTLTKNSYSTVTVPDYMMSGYYYLSNVGFFRYNTGQKGAEDTTDPNEAYYKSLYEQNALYAQQYKIKFDKRSSDVKVTISYDENSVADLSSVSAVLKAPNGLSYDFNKLKAGEMTCSLKDVIAGEWEVSILPKDIKVTALNANSSQTESETIKEEYYFMFDSDMQNVLFTVEYFGLGEVSAMLVDERGNTQEFEIVEEDKKNQSDTRRLEYLSLYLSEGEYTVYIYHFTDTAIKDCSYKQVENEEERDVIIITQ